MKEQQMLTFFALFPFLILIHSTERINEWPLPPNDQKWNDIHKSNVGISNKRPSQPNYVIFFVDDIGYGDVGFTGHPNINTPNIDKLASEGMILTTFYTGQPICSPSRAAMLTGRYPVRSGCAGGWKGGVFYPDSMGGLPTNESTFASVLGKAGYATKMIGKWHVGQRKKFWPQNHGFDESFWIPYSVDMGTSAWRPIESAESNKSTYLPLPLMNGSTVFQQPVDLSKVSELYIQEASAFIESQSASNTPFVLYMAHSHVHVPDFTNNQFCNSSIRGRYGDAVQEVDHVVGSIYAAVVKAGIAEKTLTFFTGDNGPWLQKKFAGGSAGLFREGKFTTWEGGMRQPSFAHWPGQIVPGSKSHQVASTMDIFMFRHQHFCSFNQHQSGRTMVKLSDAKKHLPKDDRIYDGKDMSDIIFNENEGKSHHHCYPMYGGDIIGPRTSAEKIKGECPYKSNNPKQIACSGIWAIRCEVPNYSGSYKAHWVTRYVTGKVAVENPPLLFNIDWDPSELHPISKNNSNYEPIMEYLTKKRKEALDSVKKVKNQILEGNDKQYEICGAPNSQQQFPQYPNCTMTEEGFNGFTCDPVCYDEDNCADPGAPIGPGSERKNDGYFDDDVQTGPVTEVIIHHN